MFNTPYKHTEYILCMNAIQQKKLKFSPFIKLKSHIPNSHIVNNLIKIVSERNFMLSRFDKNIPTSTLLKSLMSDIESQVRALSKAVHREFKENVCVFIQGMDCPSHHSLPTWSSITWPLYAFEFATPRPKHKFSLQIDALYSRDYHLIYHFVILRSSISFKLQASKKTILFGHRKLPVQYLRIIIFIPPTDIHELDLVRWAARVT